MPGLRIFLPASRSANRPARRGQASGFTLVEVLTVIVIIAILASLTVTIMKYVEESQDMTKAKSEMAVILSALDQFKQKYGDYPPMDNSTGLGSPAAEQNLLQALSGRARWTQDSSGAIRWETIPMSRQLNDGASSPGSSTPYNWGVAFIDLDQFTVDKDATSASGYADNGIIHDPWWQDGLPTDNGYLYRYKVSADLTHPENRSWQTVGPILVSRGPNQRPITADDNFIWKSVGSKSTNTGVIDISYFDATANPDLADNIIMGAGVQTP